MKNPYADQETTVRQIRQYLFKHGVKIAINDLIASVTVARMTLYKWYGDAEGIVTAGVESAHLEITGALARLPGRIGGDGGARGAGIGDARDGVPPPSGRLFLEYCRILRDPELCGGVVLRALMEYPDPASGVHLAAARCVERHVRSFERALANDGAAQPLRRARMLVAGAAGLLAVDGILDPESRATLPAALFASTMNEGAQAP